MTNRLFSDRINLSIGEADFLCKDNTPLVNVEEQTVFPIDRLPKGFLLEDKMGAHKGKKRPEHSKRLKELYRQGRKMGFQKGHLPYSSCFQKGNAWSKLHPELMPRGENHHFWKGGKTVNTQGYILIHKPKHPYCNIVGYVREHRLIIEKQIGRYLLSNEKCHHLNGIRKDNHIKNLMVFISLSAHSRFHKNRNNVKPEEIIFDGR